MFRLTRNSKKLSHPTPITFQMYTNILVIIFQTLFLCPADLRSFKQPTDNRFTTPARRWPQSDLLKASRSRSNFSPPCAPFLSNSVSLNHECVTCCFLHTLAEAFQVLLTGFSPTQCNNFQVYSFLSAHGRPTLKQKLEKNTIVTESWDYSYVLPRYLVSW